MEYVVEVLWIWLEKYWWLMKWMVKVEMVNRRWFGKLLFLNCWWKFVLWKKEYGWLCMCVKYVLSRDWIICWGGSFLNVLCVGLVLILEKRLFYGFGLCYKLMRGVCVKELWWCILFEIDLNWRLICCLWCSVIDWYVGLLDLWRWVLLCLLIVFWIGVS